MSADWAQRRRQVLAVMRMEVGRSLSLRNFWMVLPAFAPALIIVAHALGDRTHSLEEERIALAVIIQLFYVRCAIFFGCLWLAMRMIRGQVAEKTVHYPLLAPVRRELLVVGKFLGAAVSAMAMFGTGVLACFALMYGHFEAGRAYASGGDGLAQLGSYLLVTAMASLGYLSVLLLLSLVFKNPIVPAAVLVAWEGINSFLPAWLKYVSVTFYLKPLFPVQLPGRGFELFFGVVAELLPPLVAVAGLLLFSALALAVSCWRMRRLEVSYASD